MPEKAKIVEEKGLGFTLNADRKELLKVATGLQEAGFDLLLFVTGVDYPDTVKLVYRLYSSTKRISLFVKSEVPKSDPTIDSLTSLWPNANWHERETYDLFGVEFKGHPKMKRIFMPDDWVGYPLRKDYSDDRMIVFPGAATKEKPAAGKVAKEKVAGEEAAAKPKKEMTPEEKEAAKAAAREKAAARRAAAAQNEVKETE